MSKALKLSGKRTATGQYSGELYIKKHRRGNSYFLGKFLTECTLINESFPDFLRKNLSGKRTEQESNIIIFLFCPSVFIKIF